MSEQTQQAEPTPESNPVPLPSDWVKSIPEQLRDAPFFRPTKDGEVRSVEQVLSALENAAKLQGNLAESHIRIPSPDASEDDKRAARERALSVFTDLRKASEGEDTPPPADPEGYKVPEVEGLDKASIEDVAKFAHEHGWGQKQFSDYVNKMADGKRTAAETQTAWEREQAERINKELGSAKDEHLGRVAAALQASGAPEGYVDALKAGKIDAEIVLTLDRLVHKMVNMGDEGNQFVQQVNTGARTPTPAEYGDRAGELWRTLQDMRQSDPRYHSLNAERMECIRLSKQL